MLCIFCVCELWFVGMNSNPISPLFGYFSDLGKRSSRDNDTDLMASIMTDLVSTVVVRGFSGLGG